jgi:dihydrofolate synthase/folylpolyglutamate synthase
MYASDIKHSSDSLHRKLHMLYTLNRNKTIDLSFRPPFLDLLKALGNPHLSLPPVIHVAGTNGKGSTIALLRAVLEAHNYTVHSYTSPHLVHFNERINLAGQDIDDVWLEQLIDEVIFHNTGRDVTFFEITTALAFYAFSRKPADFLLLEVGMGGRLDCTNIIKQSLVSIINTISLDHTEYLGETLPQIAAEKAGIIKPGAPCVIGPQSTGITETLTQIAKSIKAPASRYGSEWFIEPYQNQMRFKFENETHILPTPSLVGPHQLSNAGVALAAIHTIQKLGHLSINPEHIAKGLQNAHWPARLQKLPLTPAPDWEIWLDGGHNEDAARILAAQMAHWAKTDGKPLHLALGMMRHKEPRAFLQPLVPYISSLHILPIPGEPASLTPTEIKSLLGDLNIPIGYAQGLDGLCTDLPREFPESGRILIAGSLYLAGHILQELANTPHNSK